MNSRAGRLFRSRITTTNDALSSTLSTTASSNIGEDVLSDNRHDAYQGKRQKPCHEISGRDPFEVSRSENKSAERSRLMAAGTTLKTEWPYEIGAESLCSALQTRCLNAKDNRTSGIAIVLDWDDTLFPTSWMRKVQSALNRKYRKESWDGGNEMWTMFDLKHLSSEDRVLLRRLELSSIEMLRSCAQNSDQMYIITNAQLPWVEISASKFMPKLLQAVKKYKVPIISARDTYLAHNRTAAEEVPPEMWKMCAFQTLMLKLLQPTDAPATTSPAEGRTREPRTRNRSLPPSSGQRWWRGWRHTRVRSGYDSLLYNRAVLVSIGDSECERTALMKCRETYYHHAYFKSIKLVDTPHPLLLKRQQDYIKRCISEVLAIHDSVDIIFEPPPQQTVS
ncbi:hypothetical protein GNI_132300 [Gregarina niphandrodes]|uniref:Uncharacterized protein n=1 Tax=Gregarina niphandrodes TaxID=110365 RepID=A0A023B1I7_GRENI|nr:hypothetical protein GNI_132300 [Gregarina niphandrodes]EZG47081.1 hypothetical protein GNI_132300 [Gregarina niphandrodes]|eukprot:XP_011132207.1 hypothetical protein GNI_132300 [Gregarina niphandrodes]